MEVRGMLISRLDMIYIHSSDDSGSFHLIIFFKRHAWSV